MQDHLQPTGLGQSKARHRFLKMKQPVYPDVFPTPYLLEAGQTYNLLFEFFVPEQMLQHACTHPVCTEAVRQSHLELPPSLEWSESSRDNTSPAMLSVVYNITACVMGTEGSLMKVAKSVRVIPMASVELPMDFEGNDDYQYNANITLRQGMLRKKSGVLSVEAVPPEPINYQDISEQSGISIANTAIILRFDAMEKGAKPPYLGCLKTRLLVANFFATTGRQDFPSVSNTAASEGQGTYIARVKLPPILEDKSVWRKMVYVEPPVQETRPEQKRHDSFASTFSIGLRRGSALKESSKSKEPKDLYSYLIRMEIPIALPSNEVLIPTFHSCLGSRTYTLQILLEVGGGSTMELRVPVQIYNE